MLELLLLPKLLVIEVELSGLFKKLFEVVLRVIKLSFLIRMINRVGDTNGDASELNLIRFSSKNFLEVNRIFRALYVQEDFSFKTSKYF